MRKHSLDTLISREEALQVLFDVWSPAVQTETVPLTDSCGRITACDLFSKNTLPVHRVSFFDGIAVNSKDFENGVPDTSAWTKGKEYVPADTGDDFDDKYDMIVLVEDIKFNDDGSIHINDNAWLSKEDSIMARGATLAEGDLLLPKGTCIRPLHLALLASGGITEVLVKRTPTVAYIPTGSELIPIGETPKRGENIEANGIMVKHMLNEMGATSICYPIVRDDCAKIKESMYDALEKADIVLLNGGTCKGEEDFSISVIENEGELLCHGIQVMSSIPIAIGIVRGKPVINLPGPTLTAYYAVDWCVRAVVAHFMNELPTVREKVVATLSEDINHPPMGLPYYARLRVTRKSQGYVAQPLNKKRDRFCGLVGLANAIIYLSPTEAAPKAGDQIELELLCNASNLPNAAEHL